MRAGRDPPDALAARHEALPPLERARRLERTVARVRTGGVVFGLVQVLTYYRPEPGHVFWIALGVEAVFAIGAAAVHLLLRRVRTARGVARLGVAAMGLDAACIAAFVFVYTFDANT